MSLQSIVLDSVDLAFSKLGDLTMTMSLTTEVTSYDTSTSIATKIPDVVPVEGVIVSDDVSYMDLSSVPVHDLTVLIKHGPFDISMSDTLKFESIEYEIVGIQPIRAGAVAAAYIVWVKK